MQTPFSFESILLFGALAVMLLSGVLLRAKVAFFQKYLIPSCLIGGILGLLLLNLNIIRIATSDLETFAYHFFNISFISVGLTHNGDPEKSARRNKGFWRAPLWMALTQTVVFPLQAIVGGIFVIFFDLLGVKLFATLGFLAPLGFEEGPGQALSFGKVWEGLGFEHGATIGLAFAALGFFFAFFVGVPLVNWGIRKGISAFGPKTLPQDLLTGVISKNQIHEPAGKLTFHSGNVDSLAFQAALVGSVYLLTYGCVRLLGSILPPDVGSMLWGFLFLFGLGFAIGLRWAMSKLGIEYLVDSGIQHRITGWAVDFLLVSTVMAIKLAIVWQFILPISLISMTVGVLTTLTVVYLGKRIWSYNLERIAAVYGTVTGTVPCGLLLLRVLDPEFKTPVAIDIALMNIFSIPGIGLCLVLVNGPIWWRWSTGLTILIFLGVMAISLTLIRAFKFWGVPKF